MHISLPKDLFLSSLEKGGIAVFEGDETNGGLRESIPTQRCVKLSANGDCLTIESSVNGISALCPCKGDSLKVIEEGSLCVDAVELRENLKSLKYSHTVSLQLISETVDSKAGQSSDTIIPLGKALFRAINDRGIESFKIELTVYSSNDFVQTSYSDGIEPILKIQSKAFCDAVKYVAFASGEDPFTELFDNICIISKDGCTHIAATDNKKAALTTLDQSAVEGETNKDKPILIGTKLSKGIMSRISQDETKIEIILDSDDINVILNIQDYKIKVSMPPVATRSRFPSFSNAINMPVGVSVVFDPKREIEQTVLRLFKTSNMGVFTVETDGEDVEIKCWNEKLSGKSGCRKIEKGLEKPIILPLDFIKEIINRLPVDAIKFSFSQDEKRVIVQSVDSKTPFYLMQRLTPTEI